MQQNNIEKLLGEAQKEVEILKELFDNNIEYKNNSERMLIEARYRIAIRKVQVYSAKLRNSSS